MQAKEISDEYLKTSQEYMATGGTPTNPYEGDDYFVPIGVLEGVISLDQAIEERGKRKCVEIARIVWGLFGVSDGTFGLTYSDIDRTTGQTLKDPRAVVYDPHTKEIKRDMTQEFFPRLVNEFKTDIRFHDVTSVGIEAVHSRAEVK